MQQLLYKLGLLLLLTIDAFGQATTPDTFTALQTQLQNKTDSVRIEMLVDFIGDQVDRGDLTEATSASQEIMSIAKRTNNRLFLGRAYYQAGYIARNQNNRTQAVVLYQRAVTIYQSMNEWKRLVVTLNRIGGVYQDIRNLTLAESYYNRALVLARQHHLTGHQAYIYGDLATVYDLRKQPLKALALNAENLKISKALKNDYSAALLNQAIYLKNAGRYTESMATYREVLTMAEKQQDDFLKYMAYLNMPNTLLLMNRLNEAERYIRQVIQAGPTLPNRQEMLQEAYATLTAILEKKGDYQQALANHKQWVVYRDSLFNAEKSRQLVDAETRFQTREKQQQIQHLDEVNLRQRQQLLFLVGGVLVLALLLGVMFWQYRALRRANERVKQTLSELKRTQNQLIQKEKMASLGELTAGIAHEIQNPLNFVNNFSEVSTELISDLHEELDRGDTEEAKAIAGYLTGNLQKIQHHGGRAAAIVRGMLEHSRPEAGEKSPIQINALAQEYLSIAYQGVRAKNNDFECQLLTHFDPDLKQVEVVPQEVGRVLLNLYSNAFYAVAEKARIISDSAYQPTVEVRTSQAGGDIVIQVRDNGTGISAAIKDKIFQPFFTTKPTGEGTGLGLSLGYDIITKGHGGTLTVESTEGEGSTFRLTLPVES